MNGPGSAARGARDPRRARSATPDLAAAAVATVLLLTTQVGRVASDTKTYLFIDPGRFLRHAAFLWDPGVGLGTVTHQHIGYLWPAGPLIWLTTAVGLPTWAAQRLWLAGLLTASFVGVRWLLRQLRWERAGTTVAAALYALSPYVLAYAARLSILLLPFAALPWLVGLAVRSTAGTRAGRARDVAVFALIASSIGSVNASSMLFVLAAPGLWWLWAAVSDADVPVNISGPLFDWVMENLIRNALDAMGGEGKIDITVTNQPQQVVVDVADNGKGIPAHQVKRVFAPGFTTKKRGWGLGLSLARRIITTYHHGLIFVKSSEVGKGTTFRIVLKR